MDIMVLSVLINMIYLSIFTIFFLEDKVLAQTWTVSVMAAKFETNALFLAYSPNDIIYQIFVLTKRRKWILASLAKKY